jgi:hypothetical protein
MRWNDAMWKLVKLANLVADEKLERGGMWGVLRFSKDGYVWGGNVYFEFLLECGADFDAVVSASRFYDVARVLDERLVYDVRVEGGNLVISSEGIEVKLGLMQVDGSGLSVDSLLAVEDSKDVSIEWHKDIVKVLKKEMRIASAGSFSEYKVVCFDSNGVYATDRVRIVCYFFPIVISDDRVLISVDGVKRLIEVMEDEFVVGAWVSGNKLCIKFDSGLLVWVSCYDVAYPGVVEVLEKHKKGVERFFVDKFVMDEVSKILKALDSSDVLYFVVDNGWLKVHVRSVKGFEIKKKLQRVSVNSGYEVGVLVKDVEDVFDDVVELGFSDEVLYCRSEEGLEYVVATVR